MSALRFPSLPGLNINVKRAPEWKTQIKEALNGAETRTAQRPWPRWRYTLTFEVLRSNNGFNERQQLQAFFNRHRGAFESFLYRDEEDYAVIDQPFGTGDGVRTVFQLTRPIADWLEPVWAPSVTPLPIIKINGITLTAGVSYSLGLRGQVQLTQAPANGHQLTWTGQYDMRVRFSEDTQELERFLAGFWKSAKVELMSEVFA